MPESLSLKWGTLKSWDLNTEASKAAFRKWLESCQVSMSAACQHDNDAQKAAICELIDVLDAETVYLDWDGEHVSKEAAKRYVMEYDNS